MEFIVEMLCYKGETTELCLDRPCSFLLLSDFYFPEFQVAFGSIYQLCHWFATCRQRLHWKFISVTTFAFTLQTLLSCLLDIYIFLNSLANYRLWDIWGSLSGLVKDEINPLLPQETLVMVFITVTEKQTWTATLEGFQRLTWDPRWDQWTGVQESQQTAMWKRGNCFGGVTVQFR